MRAKARSAGMKRIESREFTISEELVEACPSLVVIKGAEAKLIIQETESEPGFDMWIEAQLGSKQLQCPIWVMTTHSFTSMCRDFYEPLRASDHICFASTVCCVVLPLRRWPGKTPERSIAPIMVAD